jgi:hypothetical protein
VQQPDIVIWERVPVPREVVVEVESVLEVVTPVVERMLTWYVPTMVERVVLVDEAEAAALGLLVPEIVEYVDTVEYCDVYVDVEKEEVLTVVHEVEVEVEVPLYVEIEKRVEVEIEVPPSRPHTHTLHRRPTRTPSVTDLLGSAQPTHTLHRPIATSGRCAGGGGGDCRD